jgi:hypothetical protein
MSYIAETAADIINTNTAQTQRSIISFVTSWNIRFQQSLISSTNVAIPEKSIIIIAAKASGIKTTLRISFMLITTPFCYSLID